MLVRKTPAAIAAACLIAAGTALAQTAPAPAATPAPLAAPATAQQTVSGKLQQWLINPNGEVDGLLLADGTQVAFPPHLSARLTQAVKLKDSLQVTGWRTAGTGAGVLRATTIRSLGSGRSVVEQPPEPGAAPPEPGSLTAMNASGRISRVLYGPRGEANGVLVGSEGVVVRFPPHVGLQLGSSLAVGNAFYARGYGTRNSFGSAFEATRIGSSVDDARDVFGPPAGPLADAQGARPAPPDGGPGAMGPRARIRPPQPPADGLAPPPGAVVPPPPDGAAPPVPPPGASAPQ